MKQAELNCIITELTSNSLQFRPKMFIGLYIGDGQALNFETMKTFQKT